MNYELQITNYELWCGFATMDRCGTLGEAALPLLARVDRGMRESVVFRSGTVLAAHDDGTYRVVADTGRGYGGGVAIDGVRTVLDAGSVIAAGQQVCLVWERPGERPKILNISAQASGGCSGVLAG